MLRSSCQSETPGTSERAQRTACINALLTAVASGDCRAFEQLHRELSERVLFFVQSRLKDRAQSEEVTQEVFLEVWQLASRFDPARGVATTWIMTMAGRRAIDRIRAAQSTRTRENEAASRLREVPHDQVVEVVESRETRATIQFALARITPLQREAVSLVYIGGNSIAQAAVIVGASESAVKTRVRDGVRALRVILDDQARDAA